MKKIFYSSLILAFASVVFISCNSDDDSGLDNAEQNLELRAKSLGFPDATTYKINVAEQCAAGNHENCDILSNTTHQACGYAEHSGTRHDGTHHNGTDHGAHDTNGHSHKSHGQNHNGKNHHKLVY